MHKTKKKKKKKKKNGSKMELFRENATSPFSPLFI